MRRIAIVNTKKEFTYDISNRLLLREYDYNFEVVYITSNLDELEKVMEMPNVDELCISYDITKYRSDWDINGPKVTSYGSNLDEVSDLVARGIANYGVAKTAGVLLNIMNQAEAYIKENPSGTTKEVEVVEDVGANLEEVLLSDARNNTPTIAEFPSHNREENVEVVENAGLGSIEDFLFGPSETATTVKEPQSAAQPIREMENTVNADNRSSNVTPTSNPIPNKTPNIDRELFGDNLNNYKRAEERHSDTEKDEDRYQAEYLNEDASYRKKKKKAHIITTYSAKGGVGKTTIACNLATYIAMTSNGRRKNRVCIIDYNFDFGDVLNTLSYDARGVTMIDWALEISDRLKNGEKPEGILYTREAIEKYLQVNRDSGLYALLAPTSHIDSLNIHSEELQVMIDNIIKHGEFDYVVCDTGNNTRNSSIMSLEKANNIVMIVTQDVTTVHDNRSFIDAIKSFNNIDENRILLVINKAKPSKEVLISCKEVENSLDIPCVAHLKETVDVIKANNTGKPIVLARPDHEYTKGISNIAARITGIGEFEPVNSNAVTRVFDKIKYFFGF